MHQERRRLGEVSAQILIPNCREHDVILTTCAVTQVSTHNVLGFTYDKRSCEARYIAMYALRKGRAATHTDLSRFFNRDTSAVRDALLFVSKRQDLKIIAHQVIDVVKHANRRTPSQ